MTRLDPHDQALLDLICSCAHRRIRIVGIKVPCRPSLRRLRYAGLVGFGDYLPSPSALLDWFERQKESTAAPAKPCEEPPGAKAAEDEGSGDARKVAPLPKRKPRKRRSPASTHEPASRTCPPASARQSPQPVRRASPSAAPPAMAVESEVADAVAPVAPRPALEKPPRSVDIKVNIGPRNLTQEPDAELLDYAEQFAPKPKRRRA